MSESIFSVLCVFFPLGLVFVIHFLLSRRIFCFTFPFFDSACDWKQVHLNYFIRSYRQKKNLQIMNVFEPGVMQTSFHFQCIYSIMLLAFILHLLVSTILDDTNLKDTRTTFTHTHTNKIEGKETTMQRPS